MKPLRGLAGQVSALERSLRLLLGLLLPCLLLLLLLSALLLLRWRLCRRVGGPSAARGPSTPPRLLPGAPKAAVLGHDPGGGTARRQLAQTGGAAPTGPAGPRAPRCGRRAAVSYLPGSSPRLLRLERGAAPPPAAGSSATDVEKHPVLVPPNSPVTSSGTGVSRGHFSRDPSCLFLSDLTGCLFPAKLQPAMVGGWGWGSNLPLKW